ncbi:DEAD/DEAH box helicase family protein [Microbispora sp. H11081]|uniref:DEAD/DEAH box helicase family protein n=1 Tax=Microbispora sp. H11081 TaxID=2729107 RepID=UPI001473D9A7|nr:DEAD/DEAH box helicase family protein [Microbispora sp. H11081]
MSGTRLVDKVSSTSYLESAFVKWVLSAAAGVGISRHVAGQYPVVVEDRTYRLDYLLIGSSLRVVVELDGFEFHSSRTAFVHDRIRQNDLVGLNYVVLRFSYAAIREHTARCVAQLQRVLLQDPVLAAYVIPDPIVPVPDDMDPNPFGLVTPPPPQPANDRDYFDRARKCIDLGPLRTCQRDALIALANYYRRGEVNAACVMSVGAGKTALGVAAALAFTRRRALIVTPGRVIRGTFDTALDPSLAGNVLYTLRGGPLIAGLRAPATQVLDGEDGAIRAVSREALLSTDIIVTNFHSLGNAATNDGLLAKLEPDDIDFIVIDEAHIAAADSYQRLFARFPSARRLLMSACFSRADGRSVAADVVYRYRLIDSITDGHAKHLRAHRFSPDVEQTEYEIAWPDGIRESIVGKDALLAVLEDERKVARITATSEEPIRRIMTIVRDRLAIQTNSLAPVRPRVLFAALGQLHAEQISRIANEYGIASATLHHSMTDSDIAATRKRFEADSGNLQAIVQLKMLGQGYDLPAITVVVPMRPFGTFGEFYQLVGRGIRVVHHPQLNARQEQHLDLVYHGELGLDSHLETLRVENDMDPHPADADAFGDAPLPDRATRPGTRSSVPMPSVSVLAEQGDTRQQFLHTLDQVQARRQERELHALANSYARYAATTPNPKPFEEFVAVIRSTHG